MFFVRLFILATFIIVGQFTSAQSLVDEHPAFIDLNAGLRLYGNNSSDSFNLQPAGIHLDFGSGYMFNPCIGLKLEVGIDQFYSTQKSNKEISSATVYYNGNLQFLFSPAALGKFRTDNFDLILHAGGGISSISNKEYRDSIMTFNDKGIKGNDDAYHAVFGITPKIGLGDATFLNFDLSYKLIFKQDFVVERLTANPIRGTVSFPTFSIGFTFKL